MQRRGSAACCLGEFGDMDLDTAMQEVEAESEQCVDGDLPHPWEKERDEDKTGGGERAPGDHQMLLPHTGNKHWHRQRIENSTHRESGDEKSRDRCARLANLEKEQRHVGEEPVDEDCFEEHGYEADFGPWVGKDAAEIGHHYRTIEGRRRRRRNAAEGEERHDG